MQDGTRQKVPKNGRFLIAKKAVVIKITKYKCSNRIILAKFRISDYDKNKDVYFLCLKG